MDDFLDNYGRTITSANSGIYWVFTRDDGTVITYPQDIYPNQQDAQVLALSAFNAMQPS